MEGNAVLGDNPKPLAPVGFLNLCANKVPLSFKSVRIELSLITENTPH